MSSRRRKCALSGCKVWFTGRIDKRYCSPTHCQEARRERLRAESLTAEEARQAPLQPNDWCAMFNRALDVFNGDELPLNDLQVAHEGIRIFVLQPSNYGVDMTSQFTKVAVGALYELHKSCRKQLREL